MKCYENTFKFQTYNTNLQTCMQVYANWMTPVQSFRQNAVDNGSKAAATPCSSMGESSCVEKK